MSRRERRGEAGYTLVVLAVAVTILGILMAAALPNWSRAIQREKEEELIARGLQYAEAIRVFRQRFGRLPMRLAELTEVEPRSIRQLWKDPMTESGDWDLIFEGVPVQEGGEGGAAGDGQGRSLVAIGGLGTGGGEVTVGPIAGVRSRSKEESIKLFFGKQTHAEWQFTYLLLRGAGQTVGIPGGATHPGLLPPRAQWIGRPFPADLLPPGVGAPPELPQGVAPPGSAGQPLVPNPPPRRPGGRRDGGP